MNTLVKLTTVEAKLFLREPTALFFGLAMPSLLLLGLGAIPLLREPAEEFGGVRFVEYWAPSALILGLGILCVQHIPATLATYKESGVLRRMVTTPVHPAKVLLAQLFVVLVASFASAGLLVLAAWLVLDVPPPQHPWWFLATLLVGTVALLAIGMLVAVVAPTVRAANGVSMLIYMVLMAIGGVFLPRVMLPDFVARLGEYTPPGAQALLQAWSGDAGAAGAMGGAAAGAPELSQLGIMALIAVVAGAVATRFFRWE